MSVQYVKEKVGTTQVEIDPEYEASVERFSVLTDRLDQFFEDFSKLLELLPKVCESGIDFSSTLINVNEKSGVGEQELPRAFDKFFKDTKALIDGNVLPMCNIAVMEEVVGLTARFKELSDIKQERRRVQLLCDYTRDGLDKLSKFGEPEQIASLRIKYEGQLLELKEKSDLFRDEVDRLWVLRFTVIELPLQRFVGLIFEMCQKTFENLKDLQQVIDPEILRKDFVPMR